MNKSALIENIAQKVGLSKKQVEEVMDTMLDEITFALKDKQEVTLTGFGTFSARVRTARMGVNPQNPSERIEIPEVVVPKFKAGAALKKALKEKPASTSAPAAPESDQMDQPMSSPE